MQEEFQAADREERWVQLVEKAPPALVPKWPGMTAEIWLPAPADPARTKDWATGLQQLVEACEKHIAGSYNVILKTEPAMVRLVPRGISERAGLELSCPQRVAAVIAASPEETLRLWRDSLRFT
jgi:hypothetical protein